MAVKMIQLNSHEEWLEHRKHYIGGSECSAIIGENPYMNNVNLYEIKTLQIEPEDISSKPYVQFGIAAEPIIRQLFQINYPQYKMEYVENNSYLNDRFPWAAASLDGSLVEICTGRKGIWECKTTEIVSSMHKEKWKDKIPMNYYCQLLHYLLVREDCDFAHLTALLTWKFADTKVYQQIKNYHIERSEVEADIKYLAEAEEKFWQNVKNRQKPNLILPPL